MSRTTRQQLHRPTDLCTVGVSSQHREPTDELDPTEDPEHGGHLRYQAFCGCGHTSTFYSRENEAAEAEMDHAFPAWRTMPVMEARPHDNRRAETRWEADARRAYPAGWFEEGGPVITYRSIHGARHVPCRAPGGGYDMGRVLPRGRRPAPRSEQAQLF